MEFVCVRLFCPGVIRLSLGHFVRKSINENKVHSSVMIVLVLLNFGAVIHDVIQSHHEIAARFVARRKSRYLWLSQWQFEALTYFLWQVAIINQLLSLLIFVSICKLQNLALYMLEQIFRHFSRLLT